MCAISQVTSFRSELTPVGPLVVQSFINKSFEKIISTDHALRLLHQFEYILNRDSLKVRLQTPSSD